MRAFDVVLRAEVDGEAVISAVAIGIDDDSDSVFSDTLVIAGGVSCTDATGIAFNGSDATLDEVSIFVLCGGEAKGIDISGGSAPQITNAKVFVTSAFDDATGIESSGTGNAIAVRDTVIEVDGDTNSYGLLKLGSSSSLSLSNVSANALAATSNVVGLQVDNGTITFNHSTLTGTDAINFASGTSGSCFATQLNGNRINAGSASCLFCYSGNRMTTTC